MIKEAEQFADEVKKVKKMIQDFIYRVMEEANAEAGLTKSSS